MSLYFSPTRAPRVTVALHTCSTAQGGDRYYIDGAEVSADEWRKWVSA